MAAGITPIATTLEGQLFEIVRELQERELALPADTRPDRVQISLDVEAKEATMTVSLPISFSGTGNGISLAAQPYLA